MSVSSPVRSATAASVLALALALGGCGEGSEAIDDPAGPSASASSSPSASAAPTVGQTVDGAELAAALSAAMEKAGSLHAETSGGEDPMSADLALNGDKTDLRVDDGDGGTILLVGEDAYLSAEAGSDKAWQSVDLLDEADTGMSGIITGFLTLISTVLDPRTVTTVLPGARVSVESLGGDTVTYAFDGKDKSGAEAAGTLTVDRRSLPTKLVFKGTDGATVSYTLWGEVTPPITAPAPGDVESAKG